MAKIATYSDIINSGGNAAYDVTNSRCVTREGIGNFSNVVYIGSTSKSWSQLININEYEIQNWSFDLIVSPGSTSVIAGDTVNLSATYIENLNGSENSRKPVTDEANWYSDNPNIASVNSSGVVTGISQGTTSIWAEYKGETDYCEVEVIKKDEWTYYLEVTPASASIKAGETKSLFTATYYTELNGVPYGNPEDVTSKCTWTSSKTSVATVNGESITGISEGSSTITASYEGCSDSSIVNVTEDKVAYNYSVEIVPSEQTSIGGQTLSFEGYLITEKTVNGNPTGEVESTSITNEADWSVSNTSIARSNGNGSFTVNNVDGETTISMSYDSYSDTATIKAVKVEDPIILTSISVNPTSVSAYSGETSNVKVTAYFSDGSSSIVTGATTASSSSFCTYSGGKVTHTGIGSGSITISYNYDGITKTTKLNVTTVEKPVEPTYTYELKISPTYIELEVGDSINKTFTITYITKANGEVINRSNITSDLEWGYDDISIASAVGTTNTCMINANNAGNTYIYVKYNGETAYCNVQVNSVDVPDEESYVLRISPNPVEVMTDDTAPVSVYLETWINNSYVSEKNVTKNTDWDMEDSSIAYISGKYSDSVKVHGRSVGTAKIYAYYEGYSAVATVNVISRPIENTYKIVVSPEDIYLFVNDRYENIFVDFYAYEGGIEGGNLISGYPKRVTSSCTWTSEDPSVATVDGAGYITGKSVGNTSVTAKYYNQLDGKYYTNSCSVNVEPPINHSIRVEPTSMTLNAGETSSAQIQVFYTNGITGFVERNVTDDCAWSMDSTYGSVSNGYVTAGNVAEEGVPVTATYRVEGTTKDVMASCHVTINKHEPVVTYNILVSGYSSSLYVGESFTISKVEAQKCEDGQPAGSYFDVTNSCSISWSGLSNYGTISGKTFTATKAGTGSFSVSYSGSSISINVTILAPDSISINPSNWNAASGIGSTYVTVTSSKAWTASTKHSWISINKTAGNSGASVKITIDGNTETLSRVGSVTFTCGTAVAALDIVQDGSIGLTSIVASPNNVSAVSGRTSKISVTAYYSDDSTKDVTSSTTLLSSSNVCTYSGGTFTHTNAGTENVTISYSENGITKYDDVDVETIDDSITYTLSARGILSSIAAGRSMRITKITLTGSDGSSEDVTNSPYINIMPSVGLTVDGLKITAGSEAVDSGVTIKYNNGSGIYASKTYNIKINALTPVS